LLAGCHVSIREGYLGAAKTAHKIGANAFQYFPKNPRSLSIKDYNPHDAKSCKEYCKEHELVSIAHTPYPTSLTPSKDKSNITINSLLNDLEIAEACGSVGVVVHFGSHLEGQDPLKGYQLMIDTLNEVLQKWNGNTLLLIENVAGNPGTMGTTLEEHIQVRNLCEYPSKIGFCFDTCHAFASSLWTGENMWKFIGKGAELGYFDHLKAIHLNNSKYEVGSGKDRHANIDTGKIHTSYISDLLKNEYFKQLPFVLETPGENHKEEIELIRLLQQMK
jgi:deoxyribonuclease-4